MYNSISEVLGTLFKHEILSKRASVQSLKELIPTVISVIIDPRMGDTNEGKAIAKTVNVLATGIVLSADQTNMLCALLKQLHTCVSGMGNSDVKFTEMVMKCIWKQARILSNIVDDLNIDLVLFELHNFLRDFPKEYWADRKDVPFRTVRTVTYMLVQSKREDIFDHLTMIPNCKETEIYRYITRILKDMSKGQDLSHTGSKTPLRSNISTDSVTMANGNRSSFPLKNTSEVSKVMDWVDAASKLIATHDLTKNVMSNLERNVDRFGSNDEENLMRARQMAIEARMTVDELKKKYGINA